MEMAVGIGSFAFDGRGTGKSRKIERRQTLGVPMLKCVSREQNSFLQMSANFDLNHDRLAGDSKFCNYRQKFEHAVTHRLPVRVQTLLSKSMLALG
jgi:hypothetical protein